MTAVIINLSPIVKLTDEQFYHLCRENPEIKFERNAKGELIIMSPTGGETGNFNFEISVELWEFGIAKINWESVLTHLLASSYPMVGIALLMWLG